MRLVWGVAASAAALLPAGCGDAPVPAPTRNLVLDAQGVVFAGGDGTYHRFPFGSARSDIERVAGSVYGTGAARRSFSKGCSAGPMAFTSYGAIQLGFQGERLVGWTMRSGAAPTTEGGIAPGITQKQLQQLTGLRMVSPPALPGEFAYRTQAGEIHGVLAGHGPQARVEALFAGLTCSARQAA